MNLLQAVIIDDEPNHRENIRLILENYCEGVEIIAEGSSAIQGAALLAEHHPDVIFLDIEMPGGTGFDLIQAFEKIDAKIVLVTGHTGRMLDAFKVNVFDYIVKPIDIEEIQETVNRLKAAKSGDTSGTRKIGLPSSTGLIFIEKEGIEYIGANGSYAEVVLTSKKKVLVSKNLKYIDSLLMDNNFIRIHRSSIVNILHIKEFSRSEGGIVILSSGNELQVSPDKREELLEKLTSL